MGFSFGWWCRRAGPGAVRAVVGAMLNVRVGTGVEVDAGDKGVVGTTTGFGRVLPDRLGVVTAALGGVLAGAEHDALGAGLVTVTFPLPFGPGAVPGPPPGIRWPLPLPLR